MKFDEEMEEAAKKIQEKYRTKQNNRQKKTSQIKNKKNIPEPIKKIPSILLFNIINVNLKNLKKKFWI